jgi:dihydrolipoamide dehydrogenase
VEYRTGSFPFAANGRALAGGHGSGLVKVLADAESDELLGVHIMGANASELIAECVVTMEFQGSSEDLARIVHAHPTLSEAIHEAALHLDRRAIHRGN